MRRRKTRQRNKRLAERRRGQRQPDPSRILIHRTEPPRRRPSHHGGLRRVRVWVMRAVIFGYFGTLTDPGAEEYREPLAHRTGELLGVCRPRFLGGAGRELRRAHHRGPRRDGEHAEGGGAFLRSEPVIRPAPRRARASPERSCPPRQAAAPCARRPGGTLKVWKVLTRLRCSPHRATPIVRAISSCTTSRTRPTQNEKGSMGWPPTACGPATPQSPKN
jgi:hypothetical protein